MHGQKNIKFIKFRNDIFLTNSVKRSSDKLRKMNKINTGLIILVIIGTFAANINMIASILPKNEGLNFDNLIEAQPTDNDLYTLEYEIIDEVYDYFIKQADLNGFENICTFISSGLVFESDNSLIVIGHGYFDSRNQYKIADYTSGQIKNLAEQKQIVALLGCYSNVIELDNEIQLKYCSIINLETAINDLINLLDWSVSYKFLPTTNIQLFDFDPGGSGNGWSISNPPPAFNIKRMAYSQEYGIYWDLSTDTGVQALSDFLLNHLNSVVKITLKGEFLEEISPNSNTFTVSTQEVKYATWISNPGGVWKYLNIENTKINGVSKPSFNGCLKVYDLVDNLQSILGLSTYSEAAFYLAVIFIPAGVAIAGAGAFLIKYAIGATVAALEVLAWIGGLLAVTFGCALVIAAIIIGICAFVKRDG